MKNAQLRRTKLSRGHPKTQTMQTADCRLQAVQTMQTVQTEYFFSNTWLTFFGSTVSKYIVERLSLTLSGLTSNGKRQR